MATSGSPAKRYVLTLALCLALLVGTPACRSDEKAPATESAPTAAAVAAPLSVDRALDDRFAFIAGQATGSPSYSALEAEPPWRDFAKAADKAWAEFEAAVLRPMRTWAASDLALARERTKTLFYPFGGPDLATAQALFPEQPVTVLLGLEPVGNLPGLDRSTPAARTVFYTDMAALILDFLTRGYFITKEMADIYSRREVDGALPVIGFFLKRGGYAVAGVRRLAPAADGTWTETPYEHSAERPHRPYGIRIDFFKPGESVLRTVYYFSCDVENRAFTAGSPLHSFLAGLDRPTTFIKAGSYLLHWDNFSTLRSLILDRSLYVLEDDTAIPYRFFVRGGWGITLFGRYATPVKDFSNVEQADLRAAYEDPETGVRPLPFHFGYRWRSQVDNLLLAERPRRPYKIPAIRAGLSSRPPRSTK
jgi:hypothetical protein